MVKFFTELGVTGLKEYSGRVNEEWLRRLDGDQGRRRFREMADNDAVVGAILFAVEMVLRNVQWRVESYDDKPNAQEDAEFLESLMQDMSHTWEDFISECLTMLPFGWSGFEIVYKVRGGPQQKNPKQRSKHTDNRIGWRKLAPRSQDTLDRWEFDEDGGITGWWQQPPTGGAEVFIPIQKALVFRTTSRKGNPEGRSVLRNAYIAYYHRKRIQEVESIGAERDLAGMPVFFVPGGWFSAKDGSNEKAVLDNLKKVVEDIKNDDMAGLILPSHYDENGNQTFKFELASSGSTRLFDTNAIIQRYSREISMVVLADFILMGHEKVGSFALSSDKTDLFGTALGAWLKEIAAVINRHAVPRIYELNGMDSTRCAQYVPGELEKEDVDQFAEAMAKLTAGGWLTPGSEEDEEHVREKLDLPAIPADRDLLLSMQEAMDVPPGRTNRDQAVNTFGDDEGNES